MKKSVFMPLFAALIACAFASASLCGALGSGADYIGDVSENTHLWCVKASGGELRLVNGRTPVNSRFANSTYKLGGELAEKYPNGVRFTSEGFPDFSPYSKANVQVKGLTGNYSIDAAKANNILNLNQTPSGYVWHHVEDGLSMQLIPQDIHTIVRHTGGSAVIRAGGR